MKPKLLIIYNEVWSYRVPIFENLAQEYDLTVAFSAVKYLNEKYSFNTIYLPVFKIGPFEVHKNNLFKISSNYDVVIGLSNVRWISVVLLAFKKRKFKLGYWGIGVTASYENKFDSVDTWSKLRYLLAKKSDFTIFYSSYPIDKYVKGGVDINKLNVANNTTEVYLNDQYIKEDKKDFIFIGTLYKEKGISILLKAYLEVYLKNKEIPNLNIIGDGPEKCNIEKFILENKLEDKIILYGKVYDKVEISKIFNKSLACISPLQAGLSVLNSMGNHTCFVTKSDAITGGEILNIDNYQTGIIYEKDSDLATLIEWIINNTDKVHEINRNAYNFYKLNRLPIMMSNSIVNAIKKSYSYED